MAIEAGRLKIVVDASTEGLSKGIATAQSKLSKFKNKVNSSMVLMGKFAAGAALAGASLAAMKLVSVTRKFDVLNAGLKTATGSAEGASKAFSAIQDFASKTPFSLQTATDAFIKLKNLGLDPSEKALMSYGNTASALGKDLNQMIEAVADAATGEFERLKEFGIKAKSQGDNVSFTFQGITTTVKKNASEIENYLKSIGDNQFAGAMSERVKTLDGALSNLGDSWDKLFLAISKSGIGGKIASGTNTAITALENLTNAINSGEVKNTFKAFGDRFQGVINQARQTFGILNIFYAKSSESWVKSVNTAMNFIVKAFKNLPENVTAFINIMDIKMRSFGRRAELYGKWIVNSLSFWKSSKFDLDKELARLDSQTGVMIDRQLKWHETSIEGFESQISKAKALTEEFNKMNLVREKTGGDRLAGFIAKKPEQQQKTPEQQKEEVKLQKKLEELKKSYMSEDEITAQTHQKRLEELKTYKEKKLLTEQEYNSLMEQEEARHLQSMTGLRSSSFNAMTKLVSKQYGSQAGLVAASLQDIVSSTATYSKKAFEIQKGAAIANAVINTHAGITKTLSSTPWPLAGVLAAAHAAAGFAQVRAIKSQTFSGGGSTSASVPTAGTTTTAGASIPTTDSTSQTGGQSVNITLAGDTYGREQVRNLINQINDALSDGAQLNLV